MAEASNFELLSSVEIIESQPLKDRAEGFERVYSELLQGLKQSDEQDS